MLFFTFIKGGGVTPLTGPPNLNGFSSIIRGGGEKSLLTNVNKKMAFFNEGFPYGLVTTDTLEAFQDYKSHVEASSFQ